MRGGGGRDVTKRGEARKSGSVEMGRVREFYYTRIHSPPQYWFLLELRGQLAGFGDSCFYLNVTPAPQPQPPRFQPLQI